jgi:putative tricarboxylic transport membrane protein
MGFVLGPLVELNLRRGLMANKNSFLSIVNSPIAMIFLAIAIVSIVYSIIKGKLRSKAIIADSSKAI